MKQRLLLSFFASLTLITASSFAIDKTPPPVWEWVASSEEDQIFDNREILPSEVESLYNMDDDFSVEVQLNADEEQQRLGGIVSDYGETNQGGWYLATDSTAPFLNLFIVVIDENGYRSVKSTHSLIPGTDQTLLLVKDKTGVTLWMDNEIVAELPNVGSITRGKKNKFRIGKRRGDFFHGKIKSVRLWTKAIRPSS